MRHINYGAYFSKKKGLNKVGFSLIKKIFQAYLKNITIINLDERFGVLTFDQCIPS